MKYSSTAVFTKDIQESKRFYTDVVGLNVMMDNGTHIAFEGGLNIWEISQADSVIFGKQQDELKGHRVELCFDSDDVETDYIKFQEKGVAILNPLKPQPWAQLLFRVQDPDGTIIEIAENIIDTFKRLQSEGFTLKEISEKTFTSVADLKRFLAIS